MQSSPIKTLRSRQRFPDDPQNLVALTNKQKNAYQSIQSSMRRFMTDLSHTTNSYHQMMDDMLQCLDLSWDSTGQMDSTIAGMVNSMKDIVSQLQQSLPAPMREQMEGHKSVQPQIDKWKSHSSRLDRKLKAFENAQNKSRSELKTEKAKYRAEDAVGVCQDDAMSLRPSLIQLNMGGVRACCKTWLVLTNSFNRFTTELRPYFDQLNRQAAILHNQATMGDLPAWTESSINRNSKLRVSTLSALTPHLESDLGSRRWSLAGTANGYRGRSLDHGLASPSVDSYYTRPSSTWAKVSAERPKPTSILIEPTRRTSLAAARPYQSSKALYTGQSMADLRSSNMITIIPAPQSSKRAKQSQIATSAYTPDGVRKARSVDHVSEPMEKIIHCGPTSRPKVIVDDQVITTQSDISAKRVSAIYEQPTGRRTTEPSSLLKHASEENTSRDYSIEYEKVTAKPYRVMSPEAMSDVTIQNDQSSMIQL